MLPPSLPVDPTTNLQAGPKPKQSNSNNNSNEFASLLDTVSRQQEHPRDTTPKKAESKSHEVKAEVEVTTDKGEPVNATGKSEQTKEEVDAPVARDETASNESAASTAPTTTAAVVLPQVAITATTTTATPAVDALPDAAIAALAEVISTSTNANETVQASPVAAVTIAETQADTNGEAATLSAITSQDTKIESEKAAQFNSPTVDTTTTDTAAPTVDTTARTPDQSVTSPLPIDTGKPSISTSNTTLQGPQQPLLQHNNPHAVTDVESPLVSAPAHTHSSAPFRQVVEVISPLRHRRDGDYSMTLQLHPQDLGRVEVSVTLQAGQISMQLNADNASARQMLRDQLNDLRQSLESTGLQTGSLDVSSGNSDGQNNTTSSGGNRDQSADHVMDDESFFARLNTAASQTQTIASDGALDVRI